MEIIEWKFIYIYYRPNQEQLRKMQLYNNNNNLIIYIALFTYNDQKRCITFIIYRPGARGIRRNITRSDDISSLRVMFRRIPRAEGL